MSLDDEIRDDEGSVTLRGDITPDPDQDTEDEALARATMAEILDLVDRVLSPTEQLVIRCYYGIGQPARSFVAIGQAMGVDRTRVGRICAEAARASYRPLAARHLHVPLCGREKPVRWPRIACRESWEVGHVQL